MSKTQLNTSVLKVQNISKSYPVKGNSEPFWALKDVNFELTKGEILGVIGRNGAGKSTLLKILGDVLPPTEGKIFYQGSIVSILDIGSGFHPDFTGYDNIFLNASMLGMTKEEITNRIDQIIEFSGIGEFIHQPVKTYSNGMYVRLAFSVAIHINPQILLLDEVIGVGDAEFQDKCHSKLYELASNGLTIILVTHTISAVLEFCSRCIWLDKGKIQFDGLAIETVEQYIGDFSLEKNSIDNPDKKFLNKEIDLNIEEFVRLQGLNISSEGVNSSWPLYTGDPIKFKFFCEKVTSDFAFELAIYITNLDGVRVFLDSFALRPEYKFDTIVEKGVYEITCTVPANLLTRGVYHVTIMVSKSFELIAQLENIVSFKVLPSTSDDGKDNHFNRMNTIIAPRLIWLVNKV